jgi:hypothetical protein
VAIMAVKQSFNEFANRVIRVFRSASMITL